MNACLVPHRKRPLKLHHAQRAIKSANITFDAAAYPVPEAHYHINRG